MYRSVVDIRIVTKGEYRIVITEFLDAKGKSEIGALITHPLNQQLRAEAGANREYRTFKFELESKKGLIR